MGKDQEKMTPEESGQTGGEATKQTEEDEYYHEIGHKGGQSGSQKDQPNKVDVTDLESDR